MDLCATVTYNAPFPDFQVRLEWEAYSYRGASWNRIMMESLCHVVEWSLERGAELCSVESPEICMAGFSSRELSASAVAFRYPQVKQMLLLSSYDSVGDSFYDGITLLTGDIFMAYGGQDPPAGRLAYVVSVGPLAAHTHACAAHTHTRAAYANPQLCCAPHSVGSVPHPRRRVRHFQWQAAGRRSVV